MSARPALSIGAVQRKEGGDETQRSEREEMDTDDKATEERDPPEGVNVCI